jgi:hypothetical protein
MVIKVISNNSFNINFETILFYLFYYLKKSYLFEKEKKKCIDIYYIVNYTLNLNNFIYMFCFIIKISMELLVYLTPGLLRGRTVIYEFK